MEISREEKRRRDRRSSSSIRMPSPQQQLAPIQRSAQRIDPVAAQAMQENIDQQNNPNRRYVGNTGKKNSHIDTFTNKTAGVETQVTNTPNAGRGRQRDIAFRDLEGPAYEQRPNKGTAQDRKLRSAVVQDQISRGLGEVKSGDRITANPTSKGRARLYTRIGGAAFEAVPDRQGDLLVSGRVTKDGGVINARGQKVEMPNIKGLRSGLSQMVVKRFMATVGGPPVQALMTVDGILKEKFGKGLFEHKQEEVMKTATQLEEWGMM